jgi:hypothetical protein
MIVIVDSFAKFTNSLGKTEKEINMDRILALQGLSSFNDTEIVVAGSGDSTVCSVQSSGAGKSSCSIACAAAEELEW